MSDKIIEVKRLFPYDVSTKASARLKFFEVPTVSK